MLLEDRLKSPDHFRWIKTAHALLVVINACRPYIEAQAKALHDRIKKVVNSDGKETNCQCKIKTLDDKKTACKTCQEWMSQINQNALYPVNWTNSSDSKKWPTSPFEILKVYMVPLYGQNSIAQDVENLDASVVLKLMYSTNGYITKMKERKKIKKVLATRNELMHSSNHTVFETAFECHIQRCMDGLKLLELSGLTSTQSITKAKEELNRIEQLTYAKIKKNELNAWSEIEHATTMEQIEFLKRVLDDGVTEGNERTKMILAELLSFIQRNTDMVGIFEDKVFTQLNRIEEMVVQIARNREHTSQVLGITKRLVGIYTSKIFCNIDHLPGTEFEIDLKRSDKVLKLEKSTKVLNMDYIKVQYDADTRFKCTAERPSGKWANMQKESDTKIEFKYKSIAENTFPAILHFLKASETYPDGPSRLCMVKGNPGMGKSVLSKQLAMDWAMENTRKYELVFRIALRDFNQSSNFVDDLVTHSLVLEESKGSLEDYLKDDSNHDHVLFILDGLDEITVKKETGLANLLAGKLYAGSSKVITTRDQYDFEYVSTVKVQLKPVSVTGVKEYIRTWFKIKLEEVDQFIGKVKRQHFSFALLRVPLYLVFICYMLGENRKSGLKLSDFKIPSTITQLFNAFMRVILKRYFSRKNKGKLALDSAEEHAPYFSTNMLARDSSVPKEDKILFDYISKLSFEGLMKEQYAFNTDDLVAHYLSVDDLKHSGLFIGSTTSGGNLTLPHKTLQEYFAALYLVNNTSSVRTCILQSQHNSSLRASIAKTSITVQQLLQKPRMVFRFACGLSESFYSCILTNLEQAMSWTITPNLLQDNHHHAAALAARMLALHATRSNTQVDKCLQVYTNFSDEAQLCEETLENFKQSDKESDRLFTELEQNENKSEQRFPESVYKHLRDYVQRCDQYHRVKEDLEDNIVPTETVRKAFQPLDGDSKRELLYKFFKLFVMPVSSDGSKLRLQSVNNLIFTESKNANRQVYVSSLAFALLASFEQVIENEDIMLQNVSVLDPIVPKTFPMLNTLCLKNTDNYRPGKKSEEPAEYKHLITLDVCDCDVESLDSISVLNYKILVVNAFNRPTRKHLKSIFKTFAKDRTITLVAVFKTTDIINKVLCQESEKISKVLVEILEICSTGTAVSNLDFSIKHKNDVPEYTVSRKAKDIKDCGNDGEEIKQQLLEFIGKDDQFLNRIIHPLKEQSSQLANYSIDSETEKRTDHSSDEEDQSDQSNDDQENSDQSSDEDGRTIKKFRVQMMMGNM